MPKFCGENGIQGIYSNENIQKCFNIKYSVASQNLDALGHLNFLEYLLNYFP